MIIKYNLDATELKGTVPRSIYKLQTMLPGDELIRDIYFNLTYKKI